ncbi:MULTISPECIES: polyprenyl synthetase family protein [unclassified Pusillimonas]|uniref:polyprenyl synthetase family protein n=1 Tax=unclassified Pusillimonas TaxID=2640016 RepID=UPI000B946539|nr:MULTISPECIES: farnesyl diphosphate synthase [unclassified Pusillimonas]OXR49234.1 geranyl transferase [Pusillimonas sp. T2]ROT46152.1 polyprenyl synthetase family protein [Pusillimonas sp. NJUB218]
MPVTQPVFSDWIKSTAAHIETVIDEFMPEADQTPERLHEAMRYAVLGGGKRIRAALVYAAGEASLSAGANLSSAQARALDHAAAAVELIHAYSLVHDDLPCMDNDDLRRGRPTVHRQFDEATAMLAGDALQPLAFELLAQTPVAPALVVQAVELLARSAGSLGMAGGQAIDCAAVGQSLTQDQLQLMHTMKTGAMLQASVLLGGIVVGAGSAAREGLERYAAAVGLAFQVADDILDVTADTAVLGKTAGKDQQANKPTYVSLLGVDGARDFLETLRLEAHAALRPLGPTGQRLAEIADYIVGRDR